MTTQATVIAPDLIPEALYPTLNALCAVSIDVAGVIARGALGGALAAQVGENTDGDQQKALDVMADEMFEAALRGGDVRWYASEEQEAALQTSETGRYALAIDPLDGSSNIDVNVSIGTIFSIFEAKDGAEESFLRPASEQIAGGYILYGPATCLVVTFGNGTLQYVLDPAKREFVLVEQAMQVPQTSKEFAINASNERHWTKPVKAYIDACLAGKDGPTGMEHNMRWVGSLVAETHRILTRGGVFLYPGDSRPGYESGRLRMVYECAPIAMVIEQAGGKATDGATPILERQADGLHARVPLVFGSAEMVQQVTDQHVMDH
ncbi:class 1 fructose-bisphosphatase [Thalassovita aquimarina]|uniref:Fructose-1,6-bisphosphatase class 1 n=1 Tax=Thalassovita aquimarina TaxID=2785917 RepID=A0ABS5HX70_9RHOB|nr:class 1 fructose-bisphosphatase [Thalassovita aquimarina]MBR9653582.1 class 1 fructose-bisphosphatase [Thalassovita aquimarina]